MAQPRPRDQQYILWFHELRNTDVKLVGGKNASLGEMYSLLTPKGVRIPNGFAVTAAASLFLKIKKRPQFSNSASSDVRGSILWGRSTCNFTRLGLMTRVIQPNSEENTDHFRYEPRCSSLVGGQASRRTLPSYVTINPTVVPSG
jgi:hypothetical protein